MRLRRLLMIACFVPALSACAGSSETPAPTGPSYTCCEAADLNRDHRPGESVTIRWTVLPAAPGTGTPATNATLTARLTGPYATVADLKTAGSPGQVAAGAFTVTADPVRPNGHAGEQPVSVIQIPPTAPAGLYTLTHAVDQPGGSAGGSTVIRVTASP